MTIIPCKLHRDRENDWWVIPEKRGAKSAIAGFGFGVAASENAIAFPKGTVTSEVHDPADYTRDDGLRWLHTYLLMHSPYYDGCIERERPELFK